MKREQLTLRSPKKLERRRLRGRKQNWVSHRLEDLLNKSSQKVRECEGEKGKERRGGKQTAIEV